MQDLLKTLAATASANAGLVLLAALLLENTTPLWKIWSRAPHPIALIGKNIGRIAENWRKSSENPPAQQKLGWLFITLLAATAALVGLLAESLLLALGTVAAAAAFIVRTLIVATFLSQRELKYRVSRLFTTLDQNGVAAARRELHHIAGRDPDNLDADALRRAGLESLAENFSDGTIAPGLWFLFFGLPGLFLYKTVSTADSMIGYTQKPWTHFGQGAARGDDFANWLPARLSAALLSLSAGRGAVRAWRVAREDGKKHRSKNAGWPEAAIAAHLGVALGGPRSYFGKQVNDKWLNENGSPSPAPEHCARAFTLYDRALGLFRILAAVWALLYAAL
ncbi:MAG: cobalamin biosynthesis protein [Alphaproteobacteria bacterium]|nr:cobalamin biosynthesis protein [Alphaproteobacteria bacterium]MDA7982609.1 cobalamin biosynthesis protein [Alphaproteobacteria bacterium]